MTSLSDDGRPASMTRAVVQRRSRYARAPVPCPSCYAPMIEEYRPGRTTDWRCVSPGHGSKEARR